MYRALACLLFAPVGAMVWSGCDDPNGERPDGAGGADAHDAEEPRQDGGTEAGVHEPFVCTDDGDAHPDSVEHPGSAWCDGALDCIDSGRDERDCPERVQLVCRSIELDSPASFASLKLIDETRICDGTVDCFPTGYDEEDCADFFLCDGGMISLPHSKICDGKWDCREDELACPSEGARFTCYNGETVPAENVCDAYDNCGDGSDESEAECAGQVECPRHPVHGLSSPSEGPQYYRSDQYCDGRVDCGAETDELGCEPYVHCTADLLIARSAVCDGTTDCPDGRDEERCERVIR